MLEYYSAVCPRKRETDAYCSMLNLFFIPFHTTAILQLIKNSISFYRRALCSWLNANLLITFGRRLTCQVCIYNFMRADDESIINYVLYIRNIRDFLSSKILTTYFSRMKALFWSRVQIKMHFSYSPRRSRIHVHEFIHIYIYMCARECTCR